MYLVEMGKQRRPRGPLLRVVTAGVEGSQDGLLAIALQGPGQQVHGVVHQGHLVLRHTQTHHVPVERRNKYTEVLFYTGPVYEVEEVEE